ncbi:DUF2975 domain-containing protein [Candidatus Sumerlaeota bacterium]|nr:DUF2975 domain-containing protein [Candidatus Sumerlaeota bacterium]
MKWKRPRTMAEWVALVLDIVWYGFILALVVGGIVIAAQIAAKDFASFDIHIPIQFKPDTKVYHIASSELGVEDAQIDDAQGKLTFKNPGGVFGFALLAWSYLHVLMAAFIVYQLRAIFRSIAAKAPFHPSNAKRIRSIGLVVLGVQILGIFMNFGVMKHLKNTFEVSGLELHPQSSFNPGVVYLAMVLLVIAEVFRIGAELKAEQDLTI